MAFLASTDLPRDIVFEAEGMDYEYRRGRVAVRALEGLSLTLRRREFLSVVGPSGCGKSTLLRIMAGLTTPTRGVTRGIKDGDRAEGRISLMQQSPVLMPWRDVLGNVTIIGELSRRKSGTNRAARERAVALLKLVGLGDFMRSLPYELSGGMQQRVALARALMLEPELMLLDEPFAALDALTREEMNLELQRVWMRSHATILLVTHNINEAVLLSDRVVVFSRRPGRVIREVMVQSPRPRGPEFKYEQTFISAHHAVFDALNDVTLSTDGNSTRDKAPNQRSAV